MAKKKYHKSKRSDGAKGMISENHQAMANLPSEVMMKPYPKFGYGLNEYLDDTISGIDEQIYDDLDGMRRHISKQKY